MCKRAAVGERRGIYQGYRHSIAFVALLLLASSCQFRLLNASSHGRADRWHAEDRERDEPLDAFFSLYTFLNGLGFTNYRYTQLHQAAKSGDLERLNDELFSPLRMLHGIDCTDEAGRTALEVAVENGRTRAVWYLLKAGADPMVNSHRPMLHRAARMGRASIVWLLLRAGVNPNLREPKYRNTALHEAAYTGQVAVVTKLLDAGAQVALFNYKSQTALHIAAYEGHAAFIACMLRRDTSSINYRDVWQKTPLILAADCHAREAAHAVSYFLRFGARTDLIDGAGFEALHYAVQRGYITVIDLLLQAGAEILPALNKKRSTPLHLAVYSGHIEALRRLLRHRRGSVDTRSSFRKAGHSFGSSREGMTALHLAVERNNSAAVSCLLEAGASLKAWANSGLKGTALHIATSNGNVAMVDLLLRAGAPLDCGDYTNCSALGIAVRKRNIVVAERLLRAGANVRRISNRYKPHKGPLEAALSNVWGGDVARVMALRGVPLSDAILQEHPRLKPYAARYVRAATVWLDEGCPVDDIQRLILESLVGTQDMGQWLGLHRRARLMSQLEASS